ncbi:hypothetical protein OG266_13865 [Streptomyces sp. NBC_00554]|uniref:hypothetical protein n=1 Tax=Streptomyces sp. NBC_00554 TaxID=2903661 RepID=UPI00352F24F4|nr:hypothetical protein OG266_13865 [Streptomyces sp. NBC_00554]
MFIIVRPNHGEHRFRELHTSQRPVDYTELVVPDLVIVLFSFGLVMIFALLVAAATAKLARLAGANYPSALMRGAGAFAAVVTLAAAVTCALAAVLA